MRLLLFLAIAALASAATIDFEDQNDGTAITNQYPGITFTNATVLTAETGLNEIDFPPHSGANVIFDDGGPITITFANQIFGFTVYITYVAPVTITGYDDANGLVATATTVFGNNTGLGGEPGSSPNEFLVISFPGGMSRVTIAGEPTGGSFSLDDTTGVTSSVPEPATGILVGLLFCCSTLTGRYRNI